ncbi:fibronectin type III domain-containing protein [Arcicella sp. DC2W]|uniref:Fibronectin type III domain-containing protein n=1 Tax=Arcicella gelida TaxID=2984195 RepID=A0ABU5S2C2_9BACT|nr:fibronectin type III domain-containing protein [Arcicella sp. DC2W]MEA5402614.1 fibronectin type III domain-containing protein [Arcicella sp. DC2W]
MKLQKVVLTDTVNLTKEIKIAGTSGIIHFHQDEIGGHIVNMPEGDAGFINLAFAPFGVTEVKWRADDQKVYWTSEKLTSDVSINNPSPINDLILEIVDTVSAKIKWSAPQGFEENDTSKADLYYLILSLSSISDNAENGKVLKIVPLSPGSEESYIIPNLESGKRYCVAIYSQKIAFGKTRTSTISNTITFFTTALDGAPTIPKRIPIFSDKIYQPLAKVAFAEGEMLTNYPEFKRLAEVQNYYIDNNGIPQGTPPFLEVAATSSYGTWEISWFNVGGFYKIYIELDDFYTVDHIYCLFGTNNRFKLYTSADGINLIEAFDRESNPINMIEGWTKIPINSIAKTGVKYIVLAVSGGYSWYNGFIPYGTKESSSGVLGKKYKSFVPQKTLSQVMGTNLFADENQLDWTAQVSNFHRLYTNAYWLMSGIYREPGVVSTNPDDIQMNSILSDFVNWEEKFEEMQSLGIKDFCITIVADFVYLRDSDNTNAKPLNKGLNQFDLNVTTNPHSYSHVARIIGALAYRWGFNPDAPEIYNQFVENDGRKGLGYVRYYEFGNERDRHWHGASAFFNPEEMAAYLSALWDGHKGELGVGFGLKGADPNAVLVMPGMFSINTDYIRVMKMWWDVYRGKGNYPIKFLNFHHYNTYSELNDMPTYDLSAEGYALMPEYGELIHRTKILNTFRSLEMQNCHIGVTEFGYDETYKALYGFDKFDPIDRSKFKAYGLLRSYMIYNSLGLDVVCQYIYGQTGQANPFFLESLGPQQVFREKFNTSMLTEGIEYYNSPNRKRLLPFWYVAAFKTELEGFTYSHTVIEAGVVRIAELDIVVDYSLDTWIFAYKNIDTDDTILVAWKAVDDYSSYNLKLKVSNSATIIESINFEEQEVKQDINGTVFNLIPVINSSAKYITTTISALPLIIKTSLVGTKVLKTPKDLKTQILSTTSIKVVWIDENIGQNKARIYMSTEANSGFAIIEEVYRDNAETTISGLTPNTTYYFRVQFVDGEKLSQVSVTVERKTARVLVEPTNLIQDKSTSSNVELKWDYPILEEVNATNFNLFRSNEANGIYVQVAQIPINLRTYRDFGLVASSNYFYKIQSYNDGSFSPFSFTAGGTTTAPSYEPPTILSINTDILGSTIELVFNEEMKDEQTAINAFSIIEQFAGRTIFHPVTTIYIPPLDKTKVILKFDVQLFKSSTISVSYSASEGALKSLYNFAVNTFTNYQVTNNVAVQLGAVREFIELNSMQVAFNTITSTTPNASGVANVKILAGASSIIQWNVEDTNGIILGLDYTPDPEGFTGMDFYTRKYAGKQEWKEGDTSGLSTQAITKGLMRFRTTGSSIYYEHSTDGGITWIRVHTANQPNVDLYIKFYADGTGQKIINLVSYNLQGTSTIITPDAPTNMVIDDELNLVYFTLNPAYSLSDHQYCPNFSSFSPTWLTIPSNPISIGDINIPMGDFALRVGEATDRVPSAALVSTVDITGTINSSSPIMVQKSNGSTVLFGCNTREELDAWLATANITENITVQFNTQTTYLLDGEYNPVYNNGTNWITFQGAAGIKPKFDVQGLAGTVWNIRSYTILRNLELGNADLEANAGTIIRGDQRHHCKFFDLTFDRGFCCIRATDGGTSGLGIHDFEIDNITVRNVWGGSFRINGELTNPNCNMIIRNIKLDDTSGNSGIVGKGGVIANSNRRYSPALVLKLTSGYTIENIYNLSGDKLYDLGELENCSNALLKNVQGTEIKITGGQEAYTQFIETGVNIRLENCYFPTNASYMYALNGLDMIHCQFKLFIYDCKNLRKFRGNIFLQGLYGRLMTPADMPLEENNNILIADSITDRYVEWTFPSDPDFAVTEANKTNYKLTRGQNTLFIPYSQRATVNQNPFGSLRAGSTGEGLITAVLDGVDLDVNRLNRIYPTDPGPFSGLRPDMNDQPEPPTVIADNLTRTLVFSHPLGSSQIVYSTNGGAFLQYTGVISIGDPALSANYYVAKIKAAAYRNESLVVGSPAFTDKPVSDNYEVLQTVEISFRGAYHPSSSDSNVNEYAPDPTDTTEKSVNLVNTTGSASGLTISAFETGFTGATPNALPEGLYIRSENAMRTALELNNGNPIAKLKIIGLDDAKFYQFYIISCSQYSGHQTKFTIGDVIVIKDTGLSYPYVADGELHSNPAVTKINDRVSTSGELILEIEKTGSGWDATVINYLVIEETTEAKPV